MTAINRPRRSALYLPASNAKAIAKARTLPADVVILDLEDAVAPEAKDEARDAAVAAPCEESGRLPAMRRRTAGIARRDQHILPILRPTFRTPRRRPRLVDSAGSIQRVAAARRGTVDPAL